MNPPDVDRREENIQTTTEKCRCGRVGNGEWTRALREEGTGDQGGYKDGNGITEGSDPIKSIGPRSRGEGSESRTLRRDRYVCVGRGMSSRS
jgi:hypothetical protein